MTKKIDITKNISIEIGNDTDYILANSKKKQRTYIITNLPCLYYEQVRTVYLTEAMMEKLVKAYNKLKKENKI